MGNWGTRLMRPIGLPGLLLLASVSVAASACAAQVFGSTYPYPRDSIYARDIERRAHDSGFREVLGSAQAPRDGNQR
jgi:hypothetical protein